MQRFVMPRAADEEKARRLEAVGASSMSLTPTKLDEHGEEVGQLRFKTETSLQAVHALEAQLEEDLARLAPQLGETEMLKLITRCLNLKKQALIACVQAAQRADETRK